MRSQPLHLVYLLFLASVPCAFASEEKGIPLVSLRITPEQQVVELDEIVTLDIRYDGLSADGNLIGVFMEFDETLFEFMTGSTNQAVFNNATLTVDPREGEPGIISFSAASSKEVRSNDVLVATLGFRAIGTGSGEFVFVNIQPRVTEVYDINFNTIPVAFASANVTIPSTDPSAWILF